MGTPEWEETYRKTNRKGILSYNKQYYLNTKIRRHDVRKNSHLKRNYGINLEQYNALLKEQNFKCAICFKNRAELGRDLVVDHNHSTGEVRGLLCDTCNIFVVPFVEKYMRFMGRAKTYLLRNSL